MKRIRNTAIALAATFLLSMICLTAAPAQTEVKPSDTAAFYTAKCVMCHGKKAEKKFDATMTDDQMLEVVMKGKKAEKPPNMPAYGEKGVTEDDAKALIAHMKQLKSAQ
jgi:mono/diheme cytochrome c family protein